MRSTTRLIATSLAAACFVGSAATAASAAKATPVTWKQLQSAPVPSLCQHPAGHLVHGSLPGIPAHRGEVTIRPSSGRVTSQSVVFGDINGDGVTDAAVTVTCDQGGVSWPDSVQLYTSGDQRLGGISLEKISHGDRDQVAALSISRGVVTVHWSTNRKTDFGCCSTLDYAVKLSIRHNRFTVSHATPYDERPALHALMAAVKTNSVTTLRRLATPAVGTELLSAKQAGLFTAAWHCYGDPFSDHTWPKQLLGALTNPDGSISWEQPGSRYCLTFQPHQQVVTLVRLKHTGYRTWLADYLASAD